MKSPTRAFRPADLGAAHGLSAQAVRNYERDGFLPPAARSASGYRLYTDQHVAALAAYVALVRGYGYRTAGAVMREVHAGRVPAALVLIDEAHVQLHRDRSTLAAVGVLASAPEKKPATVGGLANRLGVAPATLRKWEAAGIVTPGRDRAGSRVYSAADVRDAELAHLLRRGGYPLGRIASAVRQVRSAGRPPELAEWQQRLDDQARRMLTGSARLADYIDAQTYAAPPGG
ncbi:MerR family transcriptional regulator [Actinoplanes sp. OR16]|uniref:MerR family transcriptional regulator n=1 Tax=Actinoplanes sp. OR16 TaxID=946334 RepID=UPI000F702A69|nr:MerR family transcriptional regulator [Actinoplanes sp. OR16]BBH63924.1 MerR family transcriptional regulator [Actinoplanes sp. OR16]